MIRVRALFTGSRTLCGLVAAAALLAGCATPPQQTRPLDVRGARLVVELAAVRVATEQIYPAGTRVEHGGVADLTSAENPADLATNAETPLLVQSVKRPDLRTIMTVAEGHYRIIARRSAGIERLADLKGKRIGTVIVGSSGYFLHGMLQSEGLSFSDATVRNIQPFSAIEAALVNGEVDAISIWEPYAENAVRALGADAVVFPGTGIYREIFSLHTTAANLADPDKRARIVAFLRAVISATAEVNAAPRRAQELVAEAGGFSVEEIANSWSHHSFIAAFPEDVLDVMVDEETWLASVQGRTPRPREELATLLDRSVFDEAMAKQD